MGQRKADRSWPPQRHTRHVWVVRPGVHEPPVQGLVVVWQQHGSKHWARVIYVVDGGAVIEEWLPRERLSPVPVQEWQRPGNPNYFAGFR